jgi:hypothetical protein
MQLQLQLRYRPLCPRAGLAVLLAGCMPVAFAQAPSAGAPVVVRPSPFGAVGGPIGLRTGPSPLRAPNAPSRAEYDAYVSAMSRTPAAAKADALEAFLQKYPQSTLAPDARKWMLMACLPQQLPAGAAGTVNAPAMNPAMPEHHSEPATHRATIELQAHSLTIRADDSSLTEILHQISAQSGLKVEGLAHDEHIYGNLGPGEPENVLASLVDGLGYNVVMLGKSQSGIPLELILTPRAQGPEPAPSPAAASDQDDASATDDQPPPEPQQFPNRIIRPFPGPGGVDPSLELRNRQQVLDDARRLQEQQQQNNGQPADQPQ